MAWHLTSPARLDLDSIWSYIGADNLAAADKLVLELVERFEMLARQPLIGEACPELRRNLRSFPLRPYVIYYLVKGDEVTIVRVLHGAQDVRQQFG
ncbi:MAG: plasmid stabilization system [Schlesneria sp.]|nr:plasmid stabilization system [Schlesneria sp.]